MYSSSLRVLVPNDSGMNSSINTVELVYHTPEVFVIVKFSDPFDKLVGKMETARSEHAAVVRPFESNTLESFGGVCGACATVG